MTSQQQAVPAVLMDRTIGLVGCLILATQLGSRWSDYSTTKRASMGFDFLCYACVFLLQTVAPGIYRRHRVLVQLALKAVHLLKRLAPGLRVRVRLEQDPTGSWPADIFSALVGEALACPYGWFCPPEAHR